MGELLDEIAMTLAVAREGSELRGLLRLRVMAERCTKAPASTLVWIGH
jgi:hypothetical protein